MHHMGLALISTSWVASSSPPLFDSSAITACPSVMLSGAITLLLCAIAMVLSAGSSSMVPVVVASGSRSSCCAHDANGLYGFCLFFYRGGQHGARNGWVANHSSQSNVEPTQPTPRIKHGIVIGTEPGNDLRLVQLNKSIQEYHVR